MQRRLCILGGMALLVSACGSAVGLGNSGMDGLSSIRVKKASNAAVQRAVLRVFRGQGFAVLSQSSNSITFSKRGGRSADIAWKTLANDNPVMIRPTVSWEPGSSGEVWLRCDVEVAQQSTVEGETVRNPLLTGKAAYNKMLREVRQQVEEGG